MDERDTFMDDLVNYRVPKYFPSVRQDVFDMRLEQRSQATRRGMWAIVDMTWTKKLADWIGNRKVLEVMAGAGWLAKALHDHGVEIVATDNGVWDKRHEEMKRVFDVQRLGGLASVRRYPGSEILIISWPPYNSYSICRICSEWGPDRPIVYIGEGVGGCNAPDRFWKHFQEDESDLIYLPQWWGIHDNLMIGKYKDGKSG